MNYHDITRVVTRALSRRKAESAGLVLAAALAAGGLVATGSSSPSSVLAPSAQYVTAAVADKDLKPAEGNVQWDLANLDHGRVDSWVRRFTSDLKRSFATYLDRMDKYAPMISTKLAQRDMPQELIYLAMIESGFNPKAKSPAKASGLWQFIGETGRRYGLTVNRKVDERNNPAKATDAALSYLADLYDRFGSWYLAAAAYNTGEGRVSRIMRQVTGRERGSDADYYKISNRLPRETRDYVPKLIAAARIAKEPEKYGFGG
ncbi:MAG: lytic transglycosylase domain-containing protein [Gemmatimonadota bacterium]|nr:lytic transglycosylase domain-containing protein [Gemmatimonadota bacterium]